MKPIKKVAMILASPFPTPRAYGVTTRETLLSLNVLGHQNTVFCIRSDFMDKDFSEIKDKIISFPENFLTQIFAFVYKLGKSRFFRLIWRVYVVLSFLLAVKVIKNYNPTHLWIRDPITAYMSRRIFPKTQIIFEIHDFSSLYFLKKILKNPILMTICPISMVIDTQIKLINPKILTQLAPMGISQRCLATDQQVDLYFERLNNILFSNIKIGYVGSMAPSGYSKGVEDLIFLAKFYQEHKMNVKVELIGANLLEMKSLRSLMQELEINEKFLAVEPHVQHSIALKKLREYDILVLPMSKDVNYVGMPIKLLEYISAGKIVIAAECELYRSIFIGTYIPYFYKPGDTVSLNFAVQNSLKDPNLRQKLLEGIKFAENFTWDNRTANMIEP